MYIRASLLTPTPTASEKPRTATKLATGHSGSLVNPPGWGWGSKVCPSCIVFDVCYLRSSGMWCLRMWCVITIGVTLLLKCY